ncbi:recombinase family protein [Streptomyces sp. NBC_01764]|nr:recombinase family protein [Streptomyces sp. NBC_01764]MCX4404128.1 recombinase family protein [Streptomyces sp. NBC_01764]
MTSVAIYARVSSARQKKDQTISSQTAALRAHAAEQRLELPEEWVFEDEGHSGATLVRPALERLRDLVAQVGVDVVLCYAPDRLARKFAYQALLIEEFARAGTRVEFVRGPRGDSPEDQLMVQFQGMFAEYEKAQLMERYRRGKTYRARSGSVNVLGGAPFGYRYLRKTPECGATYEIVESEAMLVVELFRRYTDDGASIADLTRWLTSSNTHTRTGKTRWDRSVVWGMLRNPAYAGQAAFGKTQILHESPALNRRARLEGRSTPRAIKAADRPHEEWITIPVPALITPATFERAAQRLADNKRFASRNSKIPSLLQGLSACVSCGYGYYRTSTTTSSGKKIYYYRCLGSDDYRYEGGRVCTNKPVRADYLDTVVWDHIIGMIAAPHLIRTEIDKRLERARTSDPATRQRGRLELALAKATAAITRMIEAFQEQLVTLDELRSRMPDPRARESNLRGQLAALDASIADRDAYLKLADDLEGFLAQLHDNAESAEVPERQRVLLLLVKDVLIGPEKITIRHRIPVREQGANDGQHQDQDATEGDSCPGYPLRWGRGLTADVQRLSAPAGPGMGRARREPDPLCRRPGRDVLLPQPGRTGSRPTGRTAGGVGAEAEGSQDPDRAPGGGRGRLWLPRIPPPPGPLPGTARTPTRRVPRPLALEQGDAARPRPDPGDHRPASAPAASRSDRGGSELVPPRVDGVLPVRALRPPLQQDRPIRGGADCALRQQEAPAQPELRLVGADGLVSEPARTDQPIWNRCGAQGRQALAGETECRR